MRLLAVALLLAGAALTCRAGYQQAKAMLAETLIRRAWNAEVRGGTAQRPWPNADLHPVARLQIPRLGYDEIVLDGATPRVLAFGPARMLSGAALGAPGNLLLAGHRDSWFLPLEKIAAADVIRISWLDAKSRSLREREYSVVLTQVVQPDELSLLGPTTEDALTLITCYPFGHARTSPQRFIIRATPVG